MITQMERSQSAGIKRYKMSPERHKNCLGNSSKRDPSDAKQCRPHDGGSGTLMHTDDTSWSWNSTMASDMICLGRAVLEGAKNEL